MPDVRTYLHRFRHGAQYYFREIYREISEKEVFLWGQAIAFKVLVTIVPVIILATGVLGLVLEGRFLSIFGIETTERPFDSIARLIREFLPAYQSDQLIGFLDQLQSTGATFTIIGVAALLFSAMTLFTTLRITIGNVFQEDWHESRSILGGYAFDMRMALQVGLLFLLTIGLSITIQAITASDPVWLYSTGLRRLLRWVGLLIPFLITTAMFFQLFYFIPKPRPPKRSALVGAVVTGLLWEAAKSSFAFYASNIGRFERYSGAQSGDGLGALGTAFGLIIAFVFWAYYSGVVLIIGATVALLHEKRHRRHSRKDDADAGAKEVTMDTDDADAGTQEPVTDQKPVTDHRDEAFPASNGTSDQQTPRPSSSEESLPS